MLQNSQWQLSNSNQWHGEDTYTQKVKLFAPPSTKSAGNSRLGAPLLKGEGFLRDTFFRPQ